MNSPDKPGTVPKTVSKTHRIALPKDIPAIVELLFRAYLVILFCRQRNWKKGKESIKEEGGA